jgi:PAS domain S-box-containing protein
MENSLNLLFLENSLTDAKLIIQILEFAGFTIDYTLIDTREQLQKELFEKSWDIILVNNSIPKLEASFALSAIREAGLELPLFVLANDFSAENAAFFMDNGASDYVTKDQISRIVPAILRELKRVKIKKEKSEELKAQRNLTELLLVKSNERLSKAALVSKSGNWEFDLRTGTISASAGAQILYGITGDQWKHDEIKLIPLPEYRELLDNGLSDLVNLGTPYDFEFKIKRQNSGEIIDVHSIAEYDPALKIVFGVIQDITEQKTVEYALLKSEENYRLLIDNQGEGVGTVDLNELFVFANPAADQMFEVPRGTLVGRSLLDFIVPEHLTRIMDQSAKRANMEKSSYELQIKTFNGELRHLLVTAAPQTDEHGEISGTFGIFRDITERKIAEQELINSEKKYRELANSLPVGIFESDLTGVITFANETLLNWLGYNNDEAISGFNMLEFILESERLRAYGRFNMLISSDLKTASQYNAVRKDGTSFTVLVSVCVIKKDGRTIGIRGTLTDIKEQKIAEDKLRVLSQTVEQNSASTIITDANGMIEFVNNAFTTMSQYTIEDVIHKTPRIFNRGHIPDAEYDLMWETLKSGKIWRGEYLNRQKDRCSYWEDVTISSLMNREGVISNYILIMADITEKKRMLDDLISAKENAEESNRLKSAFLAMMNHELRTPLTHILGFSELIMSGVAAEDNINFASSIQSSGQNLLSIIEGVFDLALMEHSKIKLSNQTFSIMDHYMENKGSFDHILRVSAKQSQINLSFRPDVNWLSSYLTADRGKINQILTNLFKNAVKFTVSGSIEFGFSIVNDSKIKYYIKDTGIGIPKEKLDIIFDYFTQVDDSYTRVYGGIGVGLAISKKIANILNGELTVESRPGEGSVFSLILPVELSYINE